jgi:hypothetical protein
MIKIRINPKALEEFARSEHGSYEDHGCPDTGHVWCILQRHTGTIEVKNDAEAAEVYGAAASGTFQIDDKEIGKPYFKVAIRICDALRDAARRHNPDLVTQLPRPSGY